MLCLTPTLVWCDLIQPIDQQIKNQISQERNRFQNTQLMTKDRLDDGAEKVNSKLSLPIEKECYTFSKITLLFDKKFNHKKKFERYTDRAVGACIGVKGIEILAKGLQDNIIKSGYITSRVNIPEQNVENGELRFDIILGTVGEVKLTDESNQYLSLSAVMPVSKHEILNLRDLEQGLENLERLPNSSASIELVPGDDFSSTDVIVQQNQPSYFNLTGSLNNTGSRQTGKEQINISVYANNLTSLNDTLSLSAGKNLKNQMRYYTNNQAIYYSVYYQYWLFSAYASRNEYKQQINDTVMSYDYYGKSDYLNFTVSNVFLRSQSYKDTVSVQLMKRKSRYHLEDIPILSQERDFTNIILGLNHRQNMGASVIDASVNYQRNVQWFGAKPSWDMKYGDVSNMGRVFTFDVNAMFPFTFDNMVMTYNPQLLFQYTPDRLTIQDQFSLGNRWTVRGFDEEYSLIGDKGFFLRNEINVYQANSTVYPYFALDYGRIIGDTYPIGLYSNSHLVGTAVGIRGNMSIFSYDLFLATPLYKPKEFETDTANIGFNLQWFW